MTRITSASQLRKLLAAALTILLLPAFAQAGTVQLGPSAYLQTGDTPAGFFDFSHPDCVGWIEDFELGTIDSFLTIDGGPNGGILAPNAFSGLASSVTDSVDGDDGSVDGNGNGGYSYFASNQSSITITFGSTVHAAGLVFTDGDTSTTDVTLEAFDPMGNSLGIINAGDLTDAFFTGQTAEDAFLGFTDDMTGIASLLLTTVGGSGIEIDHVHWQTECVPEPSAQLMSIFALIGLVGLRRRR